MYSVDVILAASTECHLHGIKLCKFKIEIMLDGCWLYFLCFDGMVLC